jgi:hypothetical protein
MARPKTIRSPDEPERRQTGVKVDLQLWRDFKAAAVKHGTTATGMLEQAMRDYLDQIDIKPERGRETHAKSCP